MLSGNLISGSCAKQPDLPDEQLAMTWAPHRSFLHEKSPAMPGFFFCSATDQLACLAMLAAPRKTSPSCASADAACG